mgnify:CR=1 FL=1
MRKILFVLAAVSCALPAAAAGPRAPFVFAVASDIHCDPFNRKAAAKFSAALKDAYKAGARAMAVAGDASDGVEGDAAYIRGLAAASPLAGNVRFSMGNHEYYSAFHDKDGGWNSDTFPNGQTDEAARGRFNALRGAAAGSPVYYDEWLGGYHFIFLAGEASRMASAENSDDAVISDAQLAWLRSALAATPAGEPVFVFLHQPFPDTVAGSFDGAVSIKNAAALRAALSAAPGVILFSGHSHYSLTLAGNHYTGGEYKFDAFNCSSVWEPYGADNKPLPGDHSEGFIVAAGPDGVTVRGRDFARGRYIDGQAYSFPARAAAAEAK